MTILKNRIYFDLLFIILLGMGEILKHDELDTGKLLKDEELDIGEILMDEEVDVVINMVNDTHDGRRLGSWIGDECKLYLFGSTGIHMYLDGECHHIPNPDTMNNLFIDWTYVTYHYGVEYYECVVGDPFPDGALLFKGDNHTAVYVLNDASYASHVSSPTVFSECNFDASKIVEIPQVLMDIFPKGPPIRV